MQYNNRTIFCNENEEARLPPKVTLREALKYYQNFPKNAKPRHQIPFMESDFHTFYQYPHIAWLGHSSLFISYQYARILVDPLLTMYASPISFINRAFEQTKCYKANEFPYLLAVIITHSHYDHLDKKSVLALNKQTKYFICPLKVGYYLQQWGIESHRIVELDWWDGIGFALNSSQIKVNNHVANPERYSQDSAMFLRRSRQEIIKQDDTMIESKKQITQSIAPKDNLNNQERQIIQNSGYMESYLQDSFLHVIATPSQHNSRRLDKLGFNASLWASFVLEFAPNTQDYRKLFLSADGGYYTHFERIGEIFDGFDLACLESGQYNQAWKHSHSFPHEILQEAQNLQAQAVLPIHWARFIAGTHAWNGVAKFLFHELTKIHIPCVIPKIGEFYQIGSFDFMQNQEKWWIME
ncbi:Zn-dependent hydrolase [Helicobacter didelphidarum]|uniref:Zn-dependent hydrolase n=2 Tax=Helicobacter didelphidarum TaxID=2040648 RepID=A0A3D8IC23_9HELI|nr:Zn-dependent hydrolase [Helicobacter didelphidarum]